MGAVLFDTLKKALYNRKKDLLYLKHEKIAIFRKDKLNNVDSRRLE